VRYQQDLQVALRERLRRLYVADVSEVDHEVGLVVAWIERQPALRALLAEAERAEPDLDFDAWEKELQNLASMGVGWISSTEEGRASLAWRLMKLIAGEERTVQQYGFRLTRSAVYQERVEAVVKRLLSPLFDYLAERVGAESSVLYMLERYVRQLEWFDRDDLYTQYGQNTRKGEEVYDRHLRKFLFTEGINMPFSQAKSASGLSDVLTDLDSDDPLVCEVKIFDAGSHPKSNLAGGVNQAVHYAQDYSKNTAYLVIINLSGRALELPSDGTDGAWPPFVDLAGVRVHLVAARALPTASASKLGKADPVKVTRANLINPDVADDGA